VVEVGQFLMPSLGADMEAGTILEWRVSPGDAVHRGDIVAVVDTEKADIEVEVFEDGIVGELLVEVGRQVPVGTPLATIRPSGAAREEIPAIVPAPEAAPPPEPPSGVAPPVVAPVTPPSVPPAVAHLRASPLARRLGAERQVDLSTLSGSGPGGAVVAADLEHAASPPVAPDRPSRQQSLRTAIGDLMARSKREIPHYYLASTIDVTPALGWLGAHNLDRPVAERVLPAALLLKASALAAREVPGFNGFWDGGFRPSDAVHLGVAVALRGGGLVAPAIHDADRMSLDDLMSALRDLVARARAGRLRSSEMADPTITVTSLGDHASDEVFGVIYPPQVAMIGFGTITERPWVAGGELVVASTVRVTLAADHRVTDGRDGSRLLVALDRLLQRPEEL
jgi:pyruvate dehydrogenase E2 component (dihydrolipoamide acetyltransferase)